MSSRPARGGQGQGNLPPPPSPSGPLTCEGAIAAYVNRCCDCMQVKRSAKIAAHTPMCAEWHADGLGYCLWQPLLVVLWPCITSPNIGQPKLQTANPEPYAISLNISQPLHFFPEIAVQKRELLVNSPLSLNPALFSRKFASSAHTLLW